MSKADDKLTEVCGQRFRIVKHGLDETEVSSFIRSLIEKTNDLSVKVEHLNTLRKLAEKVVIKAEDQAKDTRKEIEREARLEAANIIAEAREEARIEAEQHILLAEQRAQEILKSGEEKI